MANCPVRRNRPVCCLLNSAVAAYFEIPETTTMMMKFVAAVVVAIVAVADDWPLSCVPFGKERRNPPVSKRRLVTVCRVRLKFPLIWEFVLEHYYRWLNHHHRQ